MAKTYYAEGRQVAYKKKKGRKEGAEDNKKRCGTISIQTNFDGTQVG